MGKPIIELIAGDLFLATSIRFHPPDLHGSSAVGVEIDVFAIGGELGAIVQTFSAGQADFFASFC